MMHDVRKLKGMLRDENVMDRKAGCPFFGLWECLDFT